MTDEATAEVFIVEPPKPAPFTSEVMVAEREAVAGLFNLARHLADTEWGKPFNNDAAKMLASIMQGRELGVGPMTSLREIGVIHGRPFLSAELRLGLVRSAGHSVTGEATAEKAWATGKRHDTGEEITITYTLAEAVSEGVVTLTAEGKPRARSEGGKPLPWERYTPQMLWAGAVRRLCDRLFSECLIGRSL